MTDSTSIFWSRFDACLNELRAERIASEKVTTLYPGLKPQQRAQVALETLQTSLATLNMLADSLPARAYEQLREAERALSFLSHKAKMARSLVHLTGMMGRAP